MFPREEPARGTDERLDWPGENHELAALRAKLEAAEREIDRLRAEVSRLEDAKPQLHSTLPHRTIDVECVADVMASLRTNR